jgi:hypothetical protein
MAGTTTAEAAPTPRRRGSIRPHYGGFQARVSAGVDPATGERIILHETTTTRRDAERRAGGRDAPKMEGESTAQMSAVSDPAGLPFAGRIVRWPDRHGITCGANWGTPGTF